MSHATADQLCAEMGCALAGVLPPSAESYFSDQGVPLTVADAQAWWSVQLSGIASRLAAGALEHAWSSPAPDEMACPV